MERNDIKAMYQTLIDLFPFVHSVLALTVSHSRYDAAQLSLQMSPEECEDGESDDSDSDSESEKNDRLTNCQ